MTLWEKSAYDAVYNQSVCSAAQRLVEAPSQAGRTEVLKTKRVEVYRSILSTSRLIKGPHTFAKHIITALAQRGGTTLGLTMFISTVVSAIFDRNPPAVKTSAEASRRVSVAEAMTCRRCSPRAVGGRCARHGLRGVRVT